MQYNIKNILQSGEKVAVHVPTEDDAREVVKIIRRETKINPLNFNNDTDETDYYKINGSATCISLEGFARMAFFKSEGYTIIPASLFIQHNTPKVEKKPFAVKADSFELYDRFKADVGKMGWKYDPGYTRIDRYNYDKKMIKNGEIVFLSECTYSVCDTVKYTTVIYQLETQYPEAIEAAKAWFDPTVDVEVVNSHNENVAKLEKQVADWKDRYESINKELSLLQEKIYSANRQADDLKRENADIKKDYERQHSRFNSKLTAINILISNFSHNSTHRQKQFAVDCIKDHISEMVEKNYSEPGEFELPF